MNGIIDDAKAEIVYRNYVDMSVAVASPTGLVVPVLRNTHKMSFAVSKTHTTTTTTIYKQVIYKI